MINLDNVLQSLSCERPIFHSEADFQHALAWHIHQQYPDARVRLEYRPFPHEPLYLDLWVQDNDGALAIELKYPTRGLSVQYAGERFSLNNHAAQPERRHDFVADIARLERVVLAGRVDVGCAILLTNVSAYWTPGNLTDAVDTAFRIHEGVEISGSRKWSEHAGAGTTKGREKALDLTGSYTMSWHDYSTLGNDQGAGHFRYTLVRINRYEPHVHTSTQSSTWDALHGVAANSPEPPSDEQVGQWLDERRTKEHDS